MHAMLTIGSTRRREKGGASINGLLIEGKLLEGQTGVERTNAIDGYGLLRVFIVAIR